MMLRKIKVVVLITLGFRPSDTSTNGKARGGGGRNTAAFLTHAWVYDPLSLTRMK